MSFHKAYYDYFENFATQHGGIAQSVRLDLGEYMDGNVSKVKFPLMIIEHPQFKVGGPSEDQLCDEIIGAFTLLENKASRTLDFDAQNLLLDNMLGVVKDILARMKQEAREYVHDGSNPSILHHFHVRDSEFVAFITSQTIGYRCEFLFRNFNNYPLNKSVWADL